jgi:hypothetical protein
LQGLPGRTRDKGQDLEGRRNALKAEVRAEDRKR